MTILFSLIFLTSFIVWFQIKIWKVARNIVFPIFTSVFYFWSMAGAWLFSFDSLTNVGKKIGFQYYYLLDKMFPVYYDETYNKVIWMYGVFIICLQFFIWIGLKKLNQLPDKDLSNDFISLNSNSFVLVSLGTFFLSFWIVKDLVMYSLLLNESVYLNIRSAPIPGYTLHQYACWVMIISLYFYLGLYLRKKQSYVKVEKPTLVFWIVFVICNLYLIIIGSRHETFFGGIAVLILMSYPFRSILKSKTIYFIAFATWLLILILNDPVRSLMPVIAKKSGLTSAIYTPERKKEADLFQLDRTFIAHKSESKAIANKALEDSKCLNIDIRDPHEEIKYTSLVYQDNSMLTKISLSITNIIFSNEMFAGHFSMYGVLKKDVQPKYGFSFKNLIYSFIPSTINKDRPQDSYTYYSEQMEFGGNQGFTINHITAWYLNASYVGLVIGPFILSFMLLIPFYLSNKLKNPIHKLYAIIALCSITAFSAMLIRTGPEAFKAVLYESVIIPIFIFFSALLLRKLNLILKSKYAK